MPRTPSGSVRLTPLQVGIAQRLYPDLDKRDALLKYARALLEAREGGVVVPLEYAITVRNPTQPAEQTPLLMDKERTLDFSDVAEVDAVAQPERKLDL